MRPRRRFDWVSVWLLLSALWVVSGCFVTPWLIRLTFMAGLPDFAGAYWLASLASLFASAIVALRLSYLRGERETRRRQGLCPACGYDLTGNVSGTCPECGRAG